MPSYNLLSMMTPNERLRIAMRARGIPDAVELAALTDINVSTVRSNLNGHRGISKKNAPKYASRLKVTSDWILYGRGPGPESGGDVAPPRVPISLGMDAESLGAVVTSGAALVDDSTVLVFQVAGGKQYAVPVDREAVDHIRRSLETIQAYLDRHS